MIQHTKMTKKEPCETCPFRTDRDVHLNPGIAREMADNLKGGGSQPCWETVEDWDENGVPVYSENEEHCAGALIVLERAYQKTAWMKWSAKIGRYDKSQLDMDAPTYTSLYQFELAMKDQFDLDRVAGMMKPVAIPARTP